MIEWNQYYLKQIPFVELPSISVFSKDNRLNGSIYSLQGIEKAQKKLLGLIQREKGICYVRADSSVLGTGKSALMASIYHLCKTEKDLKKKFFPIWVDVVDFRNITQLIGRVLDTLVFENITDDIRNTLKDLNYETIDKFLESEKSQRSPSVIHALSKILSVPKEELPWKYVNIKRSIKTVSAVEVFGYLIMLIRKINKKRLLVFIDQFEEYVEYQRGSARLRQFGQDMNDLLRTIQECQNISFILTLHPTTERELQKSAGPLIDTFGTISENSATVPQLKPEDLIAMAKTYIKAMRTDTVPDDLHALFPFDEKTVRFIAESSSGNPRIFIRLMHNTMIEAAISGIEKIDFDFVKLPENLDRIGISY